MGAKKKRGGRNEKNDEPKREAIATSEEKETRGFLTMTQVPGPQAQSRTFPAMDVSMGAMMLDPNAYRIT